MLREEHVESNLPHEWHLDLCKTFSKVYPIKFLLLHNRQPAFWETYMQVRKQQLELGMEQQTGSK